MCLLWHRVPGLYGAGQLRSETLPSCPDGNLWRHGHSEPQPDDGITYAEKLTAQDRTLDLTRPADENVRIVRALHPHIGARIALPDGSFLGVHDAAIGPDGALELVTVQPAGGRPMAYAEYLRGHPPVPLT